LDALFSCLFYALTFLAFSVETASANASDFIVSDSCRALHLDEKVKVKWVFDGDTFELNDGRRIRFIGINAPEMGHNGALDQPLALQAKKKVKAFIAKSHSIWLSFEKEHYDHYGRVLAHVFNGKGENLEQQLLAEGLAFPIYFPPDIDMLNCVKTASDQAREKKIGVWRLPYYRPLSSTDLNGLSSGFHRIKDTVVRVYLRPGRTWWIDLDGEVAISISKKNQRFFNRKDIRDLIGTKLDVSGWLIHRKLTTNQRKKGYKPYIMSLRYPASIIK